jgi:hypothetical protein
MILCEPGYADNQIARVEDFHRTARGENELVHPHSAVRECGCD